MGFHNTDNYLAYLAAGRRETAWGGIIVLVNPPVKMKSLALAVNPILRLGADARAYTDLIRDRDGTAC